MSPALPRTLMGNASLAVLGVALGAAILMSNMAARSMEIGQPAIALGLPIGGGGPRALIAQAAAERGAERSSVLALARAAIRRSPVNYPAFRAAALVEPARAGPLLAQAVAWTRRDPNAVIDLYRNRIRQGDTAGALDAAEALLRLQQQDEAIYPDLARRMTDPAFRARVADRMAAASGWRGRFFEMVPTRPDTAGWLLDLAETVDRRGVALGRREVAPLLAGLVQLGPEPAGLGYEYWRRHFAPANPLAWPGEASANALLPFDWSIPPGLRGSVYFSGHGLAYDVQPGDNPVIARKLAALAPGTYRLTIAGNDKAPVRWSLYCPDGGAAIPAEGEESFVIPAGCGRQLIELSVSPGSGTIGTVKAEPAP